MGQNPDSVSAVSGIDGTSRNNNRPCGVTECFHLRKHTVEFHSVVKRQEASRVFQQDEFWEYKSNNGKSLWPEPAVISRAELLPGS